MEGWFFSGAGRSIDILCRVKNEDNCWCHISLIALGVGFLLFSRSTQIIVI